ncbi:MAG: hypothetical protein K9L17_07435 [Clostridiales bacterium]|nr:hypothetical protein [Clostridiales bacterium]MCF8022503.1 hypothetical protein [Clostridiales bacterium]
MFGQKVAKITRVFIVFLLAVFMTITLFLLWMPLNARTYFYEIYRELLKTKTIVNTWAWDSLESKHFVLRYKAGDEKNAQMVIKVAEKYFKLLANKYEFAISTKIPVIIYPTRKELNSYFGWPASESAMGVYWGGVIRILSPEAWIEYKHEQEKNEIFDLQGPVAHELTHLIIDYKCRGNYPRWFTEGVAQYEEFKLTGYIIGSSEKKLNARHYSFDRIGTEFDKLPDQTLAYRQSLSMVQYIIEHHNEEEMNKIITKLSSGWSLNDIFCEVITLNNFEENWQIWLNNKVKEGYIK